MAGHLNFATISIITMCVLAVACLGGEDNNALEDPGVLLAPGRTHLSLCVDSGGGREASDADFAVVQAALDQAISGLTVIPPEIGEPSLHAGCPAAVEFTGERRSFPEETQNARYLTMGNLSPHRVFVYFVPQDAFLAAYAHLEVAVAQETSEYLCENEPVTPDFDNLPRQGFRDGPACGIVTTSLYVPDDAGSDDISNGILRVLGLHERLPEPTIDWQLCVTGSDASYCEVYQVCIPPMHTSPEFCEEFWDRTGLERPQTSPP